MSESSLGLVQRLRNFLAHREEDAGLKEWFNQFARDLERMREELIGSLEGFSKEFAAENATVKATFRSQVDARVDQFKKEAEAELQKRRVALEEDFTEFAGRMMEAWKSVEAQLLSELQEERSRARTVFLTEAEQERSRIKTELLESQRQRAVKLEEELNKFSEALASRHGEAYRRL